MSEELPQLHPEVQRALAENELLRTELAARVAELHELEHVVRPFLLATFQAALGPWELRLMEAQAAVGRVRRATQLVQAVVNQGAVPDMVAINGLLEEEFAAWQLRLQEQADAIAKAQFSLIHRLSVKESQQLKQLFKDLAKALHPDVNPGQTAAQQELWLQVLNAHEKGNLASMEALALLVQTPGASAPQESALEALHAERERLRSLLAALLAQLAKLQQEPPFCFEAQWLDHAWVAARRAEIDGQIRGLNEQQAALQKHLDALLEVHGTGKFGLN